MKRIAAVLLFACMLTGLAHAAQPNTVHIDQAVQTEERLDIFFHVMDEDNQPIAGLDGPDVIVEIADAQKTPVVRPVSEYPDGIGYVFVVDISKSLSVRQFDSLKEALHTWLDVMRPEDSAAILTIGNTVTVVSEMKRDREALLAVVEGLSPTDMETQLYSGLLRGIELSGKTGEDMPKRKVIVALTDGINDSLTGATELEVAARLSEIRTPIYAIGFSKDGRINDKLSSFSGLTRISGGAIFLTTPENIQVAYEQTYHHIQCGYFAPLELPVPLATGGVFSLRLLLQENSAVLSDVFDFRIVRFEPKAPSVASESSVSPSLSPVAQIVTSETSATHTPFPEQESLTLADSLTAGNDVTRTVIILVIACLLVAVAIVIFFVVKGKYVAQKDSLPIQKMKSAAPVEVPSLLFMPKEPDFDETQMYVRDDEDDASDMTVMLRRHVTLVLRENREGHEQIHRLDLTHLVNIGRSEASDLTINDVAVSGNHCSIIYENQLPLLRDMSSRNKTIVNGEDIENEMRALQEGDAIDIGRTRLTVVSIIRE